MIGSSQSSVATIESGKRLALSPFEDRPTSSPRRGAR